MGEKAENLEKGRGGNLSGVVADLIKALNGLEEIRGDIEIVLNEAEDISAYEKRVFYGADDHLDRAIAGFEVLKTNLKA
ncbi:MAG: hypothetical protein V3V88_01055 [Dehalococcoidia bacterium]